MANDNNISFTNKNGKVRFYDGTATPYYIEIDFGAGDISGPLGVPKTEEILKLNVGNSDADGHYIEGPDDKIFEPGQVSLSFMITSKAQSDFLLDWLDAMNYIGSTATVNSHTLVTTKGTTNRDGTNASPAFADSTKYACNVELFLDGPGTDQGWQWNEVWLPLAEQSIALADDGASVTLTGYHHGTVERIVSFTAGTDVET